MARHAAKIGLVCCQQSTLFVVVTVQHVSQPQKRQHSKPHLRWKPRYHQPLCLDPENGVSKLSPCDSALVSNTRHRISRHHDNVHGYKRHAGGGDSRPGRCPHLPSDLHRTWSLSSRVPEPRIIEDFSPNFGPHEVLWRSFCASTRCSGEAAPLRSARSTRVPSLQTCANRSFVTASMKFSVNWCHATASSVRNYYPCDFFAIMLSESFSGRYYCSHCHH